VARGCTRQHAVARSCRAPFPNYLHTNTFIHMSLSEILEGIGACCRGSVPEVVNVSEQSEVQQPTHPLTFCSLQRGLAVASAAVNLKVDVFNSVISFFLI